jgi:uridine kinase
MCVRDKMQKGKTIPKTVFFTPEAAVGLSGKEEGNANTASVPVRILAKIEGFPKISGIPRINIEEGIRWNINAIEALRSESRDNAPLVVLYAGGSGSGKTTFARVMAEAIGKSATYVPSMDNYYKGAQYISEKKITHDHPDSVKLPLVKENILKLKAGKAIEMPVYEKSVGEPVEGKTIEVEPNDVMIFEGIFALRDEVLREGTDRLGDLRAFIDSTKHARLFRRLMRDVRTGQTSWSPLEQLKYVMTVAEPAYKEFVEPTMANADVIIDNPYNPFKETVKACVNEKQVKYALPVGGAVDSEKLRAIGSYIGSVRQDDMYYVPLDGSFSRTGEILKVRIESGGTWQFVYKAPKELSNKLDRQVLEFEIDGSSMECVSEAYKSASTRVEKNRKIYLIDGQRVNIDTDVRRDGRELGAFVEIQRPSDGRVTDAEKKVLGLLPKPPAPPENVRTIYPLGPEAILKPYSEM